MRMAPIGGNLTIQLQVGRHHLVHIGTSMHLSLFLWCILPQGRVLCSPSLPWLHAWPLAAAPKPRLIPNPPTTYTTGPQYPRPSWPSMSESQSLILANSRAIISPCTDTRIPAQTSPDSARGPVPNPLKPPRLASIRAPKPFQSAAGSPTPHIRKGAEWNSLKRFLGVPALAQLGPRLLRPQPAGGTNRPCARAQTHARR